MKITHVFLVYKYHPKCLGIFQPANCYCWWLKSCTGWDVWNPINNGISTTNLNWCRFSSINSSLQEGRHPSPWSALLGLAKGPSSIGRRRSLVHPRRRRSVPCEAAVRNGEIFSAAVAIRKHVQILFVKHFVWGVTNKKPMDSIQSIKERIVEEPYIQWSKSILRHLTILTGQMQEWFRNKKRSFWPLEC